MKRILLLLLGAALLIPSPSLRAESVLLNNGWLFSLGDASSRERDHTHGTEYFTYLSKARSADHSHAPSMNEFDDRSWRKVSLPHDWAVDLPFSGQASHSHGYKCIGWKYPEASVGWYRKHLEIPASDQGKQIWIEFEGVYRDCEVFCNGFYLGHEKSGYVSRVYDLGPYLDYGGDNVIAVRCDATLEEGWYYEGAGIYRNVWLHKAGPVAMKPYSLDLNGREPVFETVLRDASVDPGKVSSRVRILDAEGKTAEGTDHLWSPEDPYLYTYEITLLYDGQVSAVYRVRHGVRTAAFDPERGFLLNGKPLKLKGCNLHLDHAGVGTGVPDRLWRYRLEQLKKVGFNAIRSSHNPASPSMLDLCDEMGILVIDENRAVGTNAEQMDQLAHMICRDRNHPSIILWSIGNEEWSLEGNPKGKRIARLMAEEAHRLDPSRKVTYGNAGGREMVLGSDVFGYNYIVQNPVDEYHRKYPVHPVVGTEETTGAGTRGKYETVPGEGWMLPLNRIDTLGRKNVIEHGWRFYKERPWTAGLFYWTGQDYRGEPNPMSWPATGSQFGILDYCCFPKDEAFYLQSVWKEEPMVHICGPYRGSIRVYSNCEKVALYADGRYLGKKSMPEDGHLDWTVGKAEQVEARGFIGKHRAARSVWPEPPVPEPVITVSASSLKPDGQDLLILDVRSDAKELPVSVENAEFLGWGNGNPGFKEVERPFVGNSLTVKPFSGRVQILVRSREGASGVATVRIGPQTLSIPLQ